MSRPRTRVAKAIDAELEQVTLALLDNSTKRVKRATNQQFLKSPLRYPGGKSRAVKHIIEIIPRDIDTLCSPFLGGSSIELAYAQKGVKVYGYDAFKPLVNFWQILIKKAPELAEVIRKYHPMTRATFYSLQHKYFKLDDKLEMAAVFFLSQ